MPEDNGFSLTMNQVDDFEFEVRFDWEHLAALTMDEPEPVGHGKGPNASRLLGAAAGNCLSASLLFCLQKSRAPVSGMETRVKGALRRNEEGRWRIGSIDVEIILETADVDLKRLSRCLRLFEDYCVVTASIRAGIDVGVTVVDSSGEVLFRDGDVMVG